jgi:hypothetical protein
MNVSAATRPPEKGVTKAGIDPKNMNLPPSKGVLDRRSYAAFTA